MSRCSAAVVGVAVGEHFMADSRKSDNEIEDSSATFWIHDIVERRKLNFLVGIDGHEALSVSVYIFRLVRHACQG